jgi:hypothetical protein
VTRVPTLPPTEGVPVIRTHFVDDALWERLKAEILSLTEEGFSADVEFVDDDAFAGAGEDEVVRSVPGRYPNTFPHPVLFVVDAVTAGTADHPVLVVDLDEEPEASFRSTPRGIQSIENNLSIANMDFDEFAAAADEDGIFRGF